jgi:hypothetical protein
LPTGIHRQFASGGFQQFRDRLLSDRDVQRCVRYDRKNRSNELDIELNLDSSIKVADAMSWPVHRVDGDTPIIDVARRMLNDKISSLLADLYPVSNCLSVGGI